MNKSIPIKIEEEPIEQINKCIKDSVKSEPKDNVSGGNHLKKGMKQEPIEIKEEPMDEEQKDIPNKVKIEMKENKQKIQIKIKDEDDDEETKKYIKNFKHAIINKLIDENKPEHMNKQKNNNIIPPESFNINKDKYKKKIDTIKKYLPKLKESLEKAEASFNLTKAVISSIHNDKEIPTGLFKKFNKNSEK